MARIRDLRVGQTLRPGQRGTRRYVERFGDRLVAVRYRYDAARQCRATTVEVVVEAGAWRPSVRADDTVAVRVEWREADVAGRVKREGGTWDPVRKRWLLRYDAVVRLGYESRAETLSGLWIQRPSPDGETGHRT